MLRGLDVCAGSGIGSACFEALGLCRTVCYVENDAYCQRLLVQRMLDGWLSPAPIWDDIRTFGGTPWAGRVDFIFGGIPCQPWSVAGKRQGSADARDLWPDFYRIVREVGPRFVLLENVPGLLTGDGGRQFGTILGQLAEAGYCVEWHVLGADDVGAPHRRKRVWVLAHWQGHSPCADTFGERSYRTQEHQHGRPELRGVELRDEQVGEPGQVGDALAHSPRGRQRADGCPPGSAGHADERGEVVAYADARGWGGRGNTDTYRPLALRSEAVADAEGQPLRPGLREGGTGGQRGRRLGDCGGEGDVADAASLGHPLREGLAGDSGRQQQAAERGGGAAPGVPDAPFGEDNDGDCRGVGEAQGGGKGLDASAGIGCEPGGRGLEPGLGRVASRLAVVLDGFDSAAGWWDAEPTGIPRVAAGVPDRVNRLRTIGNGWVPQVAAVAAGRIAQLAHVMLPPPLYDT